MPVTRLFLHPALIIVGAATACFLAAEATVLAGLKGNEALPADCAIVFGSRIHFAQDPASGKVVTVAGPAITRRVDTAASLYQGKYIKKLFVSGGKGSRTQATEASIMRARALEDGVPPGDIVEEGESRSTLENLLNTRGLMRDCKTVIGISDDYHLARIRFLAAKIGWENFHTYPAAIRSTAGFWLWSVFREGLAMLWYTVN